MESPLWRRCCRRLTVEPSFFLVAYSLALFEAPFQDLLLKRICQQTIEIPYDWCDVLPQHPEAETIVHPKAATLLMAGGLMETVLPALTSCLAGAWSDRAGSRKPLIVIPLAGYILKFALLAVIMSVPTVPVEYFLVGSVPVSISGGFTTFFGAVSSVVGDETEDAHGSLRTYRLGLLQVVFIVGLLPGGLTSSATLHALGHTGVFILSGAACFLALLIALTTISETYTTNISHEGDNESCLLKDVAQTIIKRRDNGRQMLLVLSVSSLATSIMAYNGESNLYYMYGRKEFKWTVMDFTLYRSISYGLQMVGTFFAVYVLSRKMNFGDAPLALVSYSGACAGSLMRAFSSKTWMMYGGSVISLLHGAASPMMRSIMSKSVPQNELGKIFTLTASLEALVPLAAQPLYTYLFNNTLESFPGAFFLLSALMFFIDTMLSGMIYATQRWYSRPERQPLLPREESSHDLPN